jgi:transcriptional regulator with GAF, ATPase, and Fis domain
MPILERLDRDAPPAALTRRLTSVGAADDNDIVIDQDGIEPQHASIQFDGEQFHIRPASPSADVVVNGESVTTHTLAHEDVIGLGHAEFEFSMLHGSDAAGSGNQQDGELAEAYRDIHEFSTRVIGQYDLSEILDELLDSVIDLTGADKGFLILVEDDQFTVQKARNVHRETIPDAMDHVSDSIIGRVLETRESLIVSDAMHHDEFNSSESVVNMQLSSVMCVPLKDRGELIGLIYVGNEQVTHLFEERHLEMLSVFAAQASLIVANAILVRDLQFDKKMLKERVEELRFGDIIGASDAMRSIYQKVEKVAPTDVSVLVTGETGTGKELVARELHNRSSRYDGPFVTINCGAIPENLLESELFGHVEGAFTGANATKEGKFQYADGGTIFLDEIGEMPMNLQVKLLRVLQEHQITKVGSNTPESVDIRVIAATNRNLEAAVDDGEFREDLFYRLNVVTLELPPLEIRGDDIVLIARHYIHEICDEMEIGQKELSNEAIHALKNYSWPGNVRQLQNKLKKAVLLSERSVITPDDLELNAEMLDPIVPLSEAKERFAHRYVLEALERNEGNRTKAAEELGVDPRTIFRYLEKGDDDGAEE